MRGSGKEDKFVVADSGFDVGSIVEMCLHRYFDERWGDVSQRYFATANACRYGSMGIGIDRG